MQIDEFDFELPEELIAQTPLKDRIASRLLVMIREDESMHHHVFADCLDYLKPGDCIVLNDTKVLPARLFDLKEDTGAKIEVLLLTQDGSDRWEVLVKRAKKVRVGTVLTFGNGRLRATCIEEREHGGKVSDCSYKGM